MSNPREVFSVSEMFDIEQREAGKPSFDSWVSCPELGYTKAGENEAGDTEGYRLDASGKRIPKGCYVLDLTLSERSKCRKAAQVKVIDPSAPGGKRIEVDNERLEAALVTSQACDSTGKRLFRFDQHEELLGCRSGWVGRIAAKVLERAGGDVMSGDEGND